MFVDIEIVNYLFEVKYEQVPNSVVGIHESKHVSFVVLFDIVSFDELTVNLKFLNQQVIF